MGEVVGLALMFFEENHIGAKDSAHTGLRGEKECT